VSVPQASRLSNVRYDIRGPVLRRSQQLEAEGHQILKLNIGNTAPFGLHTPESVVHDLVRNIGDAQGYSDARGIHPARLAVAQYYTTLGVAGVGPDDVYLGNGVSELIVMALQALLDPGDEVLVPSPDYPLWTGAVHLCGGRAAHYRCDEQAGWAPDLVVLTLSGLSKTYRAPGFRSGWLVVSGPRREAADYLEGLELLANMRMCPNVPAQYAIQTALGGLQSITALLQPGGRLREQRDFAWRRLNEIPGVECVKPQGALYVFPRLDPDVYKISDDQQLVIDLLEQQHLLLSHGTGFNLDTPDHLRLVFLAGVDVLDDAIARVSTFLDSYQQ
jgi:aspartate/methionine/tyrosine aminotransferase